MRADECPVLLRELTAPGALTGCLAYLCSRTGVCLSMARVSDNGLGRPVEGRQLCDRGASYDLNNIVSARRYGLTLTLDTGYWASLLWMLRLDEKVEKDDEFRLLESI